MMTLCASVVHQPHAPQVRALPRHFKHELMRWEKDPAPKLQYMMQKTTCLVSTLLVLTICVAYCYIFIQKAN